MPGKLNRVMFFQVCKQIFEPCMMVVDHKLMEGLVEKFTG